MLKITSFTSALLFSFSANASLPERPITPEHPGSSSYSYEMKRETFQENNRKVDVFLPTNIKPGEKIPVVLYGHGQATPVEGYLATFEHLARKGVAVVHMEFDSGFFDQDWRRMASDFNRLSSSALSRFASVIDPGKVIYSGHSKGAYIALMAAGAPDRPASLTPAALVLFAPAGYDADYLARLNPELPVSIIWGEADTVISLASLKTIYDRLPSRSKQLIEVRSYQALSADHFFPLSKSFFFGGRNGISAFHFFGAWKWIIGAAWDLNDGSRVRNTYIYGEEAKSSGLQGLDHRVTRSWQ